MRKFIEFFNKEAAVDELCVGIFVAILAFLCYLYANQATLYGLLQGFDLGRSGYSLSVSQLLSIYLVAMMITGGLIVSFIFSVLVFIIKDALVDFFSSLASLVSTSGKTRNVAVTLLILAGYLFLVLYFKLS